MFETQIQEQEEAVMVVAKRASESELRRLYKAFASITDPKGITALLDDICTIREVDEMAQRLDVAFRLDAGESYSSIQERTGASATTIARVSKCLNYGAGGYRHVIDSER
jgi:TrpR-related protein YerC/YecD